MRITLKDCTFVGQTEAAIACDSNVKVDIVASGTRFINNHGRY